MAVRAGTNKWPGATLDKVRYAWRTAHNLAKDPSTQAQLVEGQG